MAMFRYKALSPAGESLEGQMEAASAAEVHSAATQPKNNLFITLSLFVCSPSCFTC